jgi:hypothetical protein
VSDELAKFAQVFCLVVIVATPLLLLYSRRRAKDAQAGAALSMAGAEANSPQHGSSCDHGTPDVGHSGGDCGGSH